MTWQPLPWLAPSLAIQISSHLYLAVKHTLSGAALWQCVGWLVHVVLLIALPTTYGAPTLPAATSAEAAAASLAFTSTERAYVCAYAVAALHAAVMTYRAAVWWYGSAWPALLRGEADDVRRMRAVMPKSTPRLLTMSTCELAGLAAHRVTLTPCERAQFHAVARGASLLSGYMLQDLLVHAYFGTVTAMDWAHHGFALCLVFMTAFAAEFPSARWTRVGVLTILCEFSTVFFNSAHVIKLLHLRDAAVSGATGARVFHVVHEVCMPVFAVLFFLVRVYWWPRLWWLFHRRHPSLFTSQCVLASWLPVPVQRLPFVGLVGGTIIQCYWGALIVATVLGLDVGLQDAV